MDHPHVPLSYDLLKEITNDFSEERKIGSGSYGRVYKGVDKDGKTIAVKLLYEMPGLDDEQFNREFNNLTSLRHDNIVRLIGYCNEIRQECAEYNGRPVVADRIRRALCFEYAYNGSLHDHLFDEYNGHDWGTRYGIVKGICKGLKYLHQDENMYNLDIKPANILLDENMLPKIADFGLSRLFGQESTKITKSSVGTLGYLPPEYIEQNVISSKFDIFSLGVVIIKVIAGPEGYSRCGDMSSREFTNLVQGNWRDRLQAPSMYKSELYYEQVKTCIEIALRCVETHRHNRPIIMEIIDKMNETETNIRLWSPIKIVEFSLLQLLLPADLILMEAAIAWLVQTILGILQIDKLDAWIRQVGLADDVRKLKSEIWEIKVAVSPVKERGIGNELLAKLLALLQDYLYLADDVVDDLDYYRLRQQVQGEINCRAKNGTGGMLNHNKKCKEKPGSNDQPPNPSSTGDDSANVTPIVICDPSNRKGRRVNEESAQIMAANTQTPWDKTILSNMIRKITSQLQDIREQVSDVLMLHGSDSASTSNHHQSTGLDQHLRTSSLVPREAYWRGTMPALNLSYDQLPYHLQQCFSFCSIFPDNYQFVGKELVSIWISQGFVKCDHSSKRLEEIGQFYLTDLVNLGFFQQVEEEEEESSLGSQSYYICGGMHDFARMVSRIDCATIDGLQCTETLPTIRHLSVVTDSAYIKDRNEHIPRNEKFEEKLRNTVTPVRKLRTLVLIGQYDSHFFQVFQDKFGMAHNLRLLQMSATSADFNSLTSSLVSTAHLRYLKRESDEVDGAFPQILGKLYHLQVLVDVRSNKNPTVPNGLHNLVSMRHLVVHKGVYSSICSIGNMTSIQELHDFKVDNSSGFEITQLQSINELVELGVSQLDNVKTQEEAYGAGLRNKEHLDELRLSWKDILSDEEWKDILSDEEWEDILSDEECSSDTSSESSENLLPMDDGGPSSEPSMDTAREVLEGLEPHMDLKHLQISGYNGTTLPTWLASNISVTSLQTLHLDDCGGWRILPSLESLPFLTKLKLHNMRKVTELLVPSLEELVLIKMPKLVRCSSTSVEGLSSSLRVLQIKNCHALKEFDLFENDGEFEKNERRSWLPGLRKLILLHCPHLEVLNPLPPSTTVSELLIRNVSTLLTLKGSSSKKLCIGKFDEEEYGEDGIDESSDELRILDDKILAFHNLRNLKSMEIVGCRNLGSFSLEGFSHLGSLMSLQISMCGQLFSSDATHVDVTAANYKAFPSLDSLSIHLCGIAGKWLSQLLQHAPKLEELDLENFLSIQKEDSSSGEQDDALTGLAQDGLVDIPLNLISSLKKITIRECPRLTFNWSDEGFSGFTSLEKITILDCPKISSSLVPKDGRWLLPTSLEELDIDDCPQETLHPYFPSNLTSLKRLVVHWSPGLKSLQLHSCTALEELEICYCESLTALEGLQFRGSLRHLTVFHCRGLPPWLESFSRQGHELCSRLETLEIDDPYVLTTSFCERLTSLRRLKLQPLMLQLTEEQKSALVLLKSLQELEFYGCALPDLLAGLHLPPSLKRLKINLCWGISRLPETGLPLSLEELEITDCSKELADKCRLLATDKLKVIIRES